jgi:phospholipase C
MTVMPGGPSREPTRSARCSQPAPAGDGLDNLMAKVDQIFVLMMENRSFDHMLGYLSLPLGAKWRGGGRSDVNGLTGDEQNIVPKEYGNPREEVAKIFPLRDGVFRNNPAHGLNRVRTQINGGRMNGFAEDFNHQIAGYRAKDGENGRTGRHEQPKNIMGYHTAETVPVFDFLARNFMVCDRWFSSIPGPTWPNRQYLYAGHSNTLCDNCFHSVWGPRNYRERMPDRTIFDCLDEAGVDWMIYRGSVVSWPQLIPGFTAKGQGRGRVRPYRQLAVDTDPVPNPFESSPAAPAGDPAYRLPPVVIVDPDHNAKAKRTGRHNDDQAPSDIARGQQLIGEVYEVVRKQADRGRRPLLVITYDEHGGFFDHEPPDDLMRDQWVMGTPPSDRSAEELEELAKLANRKDLPGDASRCSQLARLAQK